MQVSQCGPQVVPGGPVTWQAVDPRTNLPPETQSKPKRRRGTNARICTSIFQASLGVVLIITGIIVISVVVSSPTSYRPRRTQNVMEIELRDKRSWGIWCGALFIFTSAFGQFSRRSQVVISLYMAFSITASLLAFCGLVSACIQIGYLASAKNGLENDSSYSNPCRPDYNIEIVTDASMECDPRSFFSTDCVTRQEIDSCVEETRRKLTTHLVCYAIILTCFLGEFVVSIVGASFTCIGLECCSSKPPQHVVYYQTQAPQFTGQPVVLPPGSQVFPPQQYPVSMPPPAGAPMVPIAPAVQQTSPHQDGYLVPDAVPPAYQQQVNQQEYAYAVDDRPPASAPPSYEAVNQPEGNNGNDPLYISVVE